VLFSRGTWKTRRCNCDREAVLIRRRILSMVMDPRIRDRDQRLKLAFGRRVNLQRHLLARRGELAHNLGLRKSNHEHVAAREPVRLVAPIPTRGKERCVRQPGRVGEPIHAARQRVDSSPSSSSVTRRT
jgi:hypothetical protein